jgi:hypothetical protein
VIHDDIDLDARPYETPGGHQVVRLVGVPVAVYRKLEVHLDDVVRELQLIAVGDGQGLGTDSRLRDLALHIDAGLAGQRRDFADQVRVGFEAEQTHVDVTLTVGPHASYAVRMLRRFMLVADAHAEAGRLLTFPAGPDLLTLLDWIVVEVLGQTENGAEPHPYPG